MKPITCALAMCGLLHTLAGSAGAADDSPLAVRIVPPRVTLQGARAAQRFVVLGAFADGLERDVTSLSRFSISNPQIATLDPIGRVVAKADGELDLKAE